MTDLALPSVRSLDLASDAAKARVRARYRAEARFKFYGLAAIGLTAVFLVIVLADIVVRGLPAFWQHKLVLDVMVDRTEIDPQGTRDPATHPRGRFPGPGAQHVAGAIPRRQRPGRSPIARRHPVVGRLRRCFANVSLPTRLSSGKRSRCRC